MRKAIEARWPSLSTQNFTHLMSFPLRGSWRSSGGRAAMRFNSPRRGSQDAVKALRRGHAACAGVIPPA